MWPISPVLQAIGMRKGRKGGLRDCWRQHVQPKGVCQNNNSGWKVAASGPLLLGGGVRGGREKHGHNLLQIKCLWNGRTFFVASPVAALPSSLPPRASPPLTPPSRRRGLQIDSLLYYDTSPPLAASSYLLFHLVTPSFVFLEHCSHVSRALLLSLQSIAPMSSEHCSRAPISMLPFSKLT